VDRDEERKHANIRLALLLAAIALLIFVAFIWSTGAGGK
jgi:hypothetical protein